jgi:NADH-quinone oxidoreductase subunit J
MLLGVDSADDIAVEPLKGQRLLAAVSGLCTAGVLLFVVVFKGKITGRTSVAAADEPGVPNVEELGRLLFTRYLWAFEITSVLLVIAVVGAVSLARHRKDAMVDEELPHDEVPDLEVVGAEEGES